jgi:hypothetical protein
MGGPCDAPMTAATSEEMTKMGMAHIETAHPEMAEKVKAMSKEETDAWSADFMVKWAATPDDQ